MLRLNCLFDRCAAAAFLILSMNIGAVAQPAPSAAGKSPVSKMDWWRKARFGMFIHWGVYSVPAGVYHGEPHDGLGEWLMQDAHIPRAEYAQFAKQFNPTAYDPEQWVLLAKAAGMKYIVITAKHHDGFALFGSQASSWNIVEASPYGKDLLRPLVDACRKNGMKIGFYYSQANDWYNPGGAAAYGHWDSTQTSQGMDAYLDRVAVPQLKDLLTKYGDVAELWFDVPTDMTPERAAKIKRLLGLQPNMIINDRLGGDVAGDITTPEQYVPATGITGRDWETCMTINDTWGFKKYDSNWKSTQLLVHNLVDAASKGGNYLLNVGPDDQGRLPAAIVDRLKGVGAWMDRHSEAIYATTASPFAYLPWGRCTVKADAKTTTLYFFVFHWPSSGKLLVPGLANSVATAELPARTSSEGLVLTVPERPTDPLLPVIKVVVNGPVPTPEYVVRPEALSVFNLLPELARIYNAGDGQGARVEGGDITNIGFWTNEESTASWKIEVPETGDYNLWIKMATTADVSNFDIEIGDQKMPCWVSTTGGYENYREVQFGRVKLTAGEHTVRIVPRKGYWKPINVRKLLLTTAAGAGETVGQAGQAGE